MTISTVSLPEGSIVIRNVSGAPHIECILASTSAPDSPTEISNSFDNGSVTTKYQISTSTSALQLQQIPRFQDSSHCNQPDRLLLYPLHRLQVLLCTHTTYKVITVF